MSETPVDPLRISDDDVQVAVAVLSQDLDGEVRELVTLTDEELLALDGVQHGQVAPTPWIDRSAPGSAERELVTAVAMRSFIARGLVVTSTVTDPRDYPDGSRRPVTFEAVPDLRATAVLRRTADAVVVMERATQAGTATSSFYVFDLDGRRRALWEAFDDRGFHLFFLVPEELLVEQMLSFADPQGVAGTVGGGEPVEVGASEFPASSEAARLAESRAATTVLVAHREAAAPETFSLFAMPDHLELMETVGEGDGAVHRIGAIARDDTLALLASLLGPSAG